MLAKNNCYEERKNSLCIMDVPCIHCNTLISIEDRVVE